MKKALFVDRDGVINQEKNYLYKKEEIIFLDSVFETCHYFQALGYLIVMVTNQSGIGRGYYSEEDFEVLCTWMKDKFKQQGVTLSGIYHCPHNPEDTTCSCRKPKPGMLFQAQRELEIDLYHSILVGDKNSDIAAAKAANIEYAYLIASGHEITTNPFHVPVLASLRELMDIFPL